MRAYSRTIKCIFVNLACALGLLTGTCAVHAIELDQNAAAENLVKELVTEHGMDEEWVRILIGDAVYRENIVKAITRPAEKKFPWHRYRKIFITESNINSGVKFWNKNAAAIEQAEKKYGVNGEIIVAIIGVETRFGKVTGKHRVIDSLITLTLGYPRRSNFFKSELVEFLKLVNEENLNPLEVKGSYAGAMGIPQFISSSYRNYAVDFNGNGQRDLLIEVEDAIGSVANYLARHGWQKDGRIYAKLKSGDSSALESILTDRLNNDRNYAEMKQLGIEFVSGHEPSADDNFGVVKYELQPDVFSYRAGYPNFYVITKYNRSTLYAMAVAEFAELIAAKRNGT